MRKCSKPVVCIFNRTMSAAFCLAVLTCGYRTSAETTDQPMKPKDLLAREAGTWDCDIRMYFKGPQAPPTEYKGVEENTLLCGGKQRRIGAGYCHSRETFTMGGVESFGSQRDSNVDR